MKKDFTIIVCSDLDYEEMVADILFRGHTVAMVTREKGVDQMEMEIFIRFGLESWKFSVDDFIEAISRAKEALTY